MSSGFERACIGAAFALLSLITAAPAWGEPALLRVCADPNNLPFSNARGEGFENELARLVARALHRTVQYTYWPSRRGFIRNTLNAHRCDVVMGVPASYDPVLTTRPYYRSTYVFVTRPGLRIDSFDDPRLRELRIGIHTLGDDYNNGPAAQALIDRHITTNVHGYSIYGAYSRPDPPRDLLDAVARREIDVAVCWGPIGGYFGRREATPLQVTPVRARGEHGLTSMEFDIAMGVRHDDAALEEELDGVIARSRPLIDRILSRYGVPTIRSQGSRSDGGEGS
jgi:mxaJ protein